jgi:Condensation domain
MPSEEGLPPGRVAERITVPFLGGGSGEAELTWGQIGLWQSIVLSGMSKTVFYVEELPVGATLAGLADETSFMMSRHQSLRTLLVLRDDKPPLQHCETSGAVYLEVVDTEGADPAQVAEAVSQRFQSVEFDYGTEFPVRRAVIRHDGVLTHSVLVVLHTSIDAYGLSALAADVAARDPRSGSAAGPVTALQPLEQAAKQASPGGRRQNAASLKYLERVLRSIDASRFGEPPRYGGERSIDMIQFRSPAAALAIRTVAAREKIDDSPVLLAGFAVGLARFTGVNPVLAMLMVGNRFRPGLADSVSALIQISPYLLDVAGITVGEAVDRAAQSAINAYKNAYFNPYEQDEVIQQVEADRGEELDLSCFYNDRRQSDRGHATGGLATPEQIRAALGHSTLSWEPEINMPRRKIYFNVDDPPGAIEFVMSVDTRYFARPDMEAIMRNVEEAVVQAALDPGAPTRVVRAARVEAVR